MMENPQSGSASDDGKERRTGILEKSSLDNDSVATQINKPLEDGPRADAPPNVPQPDAEGLHGLQLLAVMTGITLACFLMLLDTSILVTAIPSITTDFNSITNIGWYGAAYQLGSAALNPLTGKFYANFNTKWTYFVFVFVFEIGSLICGVATSSNMFIVGRAIAGLGTSGIQNGTFTIIASCVPMHRRPSFIGISMGISQFGLVVGPLIGGALTQYTTWRWCFYINLPCGAVVALLLLFVQVPALTPKPAFMVVLKDLHNKVDLFGAFLFAPACIMLLLALQWGGNQYAWNSSVVIGLFCGAGAEFLVWLAWDWHKKDAAMIPLPMIVKRNVWASCLTFGLLMSTTFCTSYYLPIYFQSVRGASPTQSGVYMLPSIVSQLIGAVLAGGLVQRVGYYLPFSLLSGILMPIGYGLLSTFTPTTSTGRWIGYQIIFGFGRGLGLQMPLVAMQNTTPPPQIPVAMAMIVFSSTFFGALTLSFSDTIFTNTLQSQLRGALPAATVTNILQSGGTGFRQYVNNAQLSIVVRAYDTGIDRIFYMIAALAVAAFFTAWGLGWKDIRRKAPPVSKV